MYPGKSVKMFQNKFARTSQESNARMYPARLARMYPSKNVKMYPDKFAKMFPNRNAKMYHDKFVKTNVLTHTGANLVTKFGQNFEKLFVNTYTAILSSYLILLFHVSLHLFSIKKRNL